MYRLLKTRNFYVAVLLFIQAVLLAYLSWATSPNRTEIGHLGATAYFWHTGKFDVFHVNPPLIRIIAGAPVFLFCNPQYNNKSYSPLPEQRCEWPLGNTFVSINNVDDIRYYLFLARLVCIPFVLAGGYVGYRFALELYGYQSGFVFLILWTFSPSILGWGATICPDVAAASLGIIGLYTFWHWLKKPNWQKTVTAGICLGLMPLTKITWIIAFPIWLSLWLIERIFNKPNETKPSLGQFVAILLIGLYVINAGYFFEGSFRLLNQYRFISGVLTDYIVTKNSPVEPGNRFRDSWLGYVPVPFPAEFVQGIDTQKRDFERGMESFACGIWSDRGWWWYYGYALLFKEPVGVWGLFLMALLTTCFKKNKLQLHNESIILLPLIIFFVFVSSQTGISAHPRYVIPVLPMIFIFSSKIFSRKVKIFGTKILQKNRSIKMIQILRIVPKIFLVWSVISSLSVYPHSLSYFNEIIGNTINEPKYLLGSCIDWGQDEYELRDWFRQHPEAKPLYISYSPSIPLGNLGIQSNGVVPETPTTGWMIIGVNELYGRDGKYVKYHNIRPVKKIGKSVCVFCVKGQVKTKR
ncbi:MAG: glycosyltransferase family 39 protein [Planctomycetaceae bacterium]|nr:glycosyltransferase family 39 protein [Planctomycetaceae bacterium]